MRQLFRTQPNLTCLMGDVVDVEAHASDVVLADGAHLPYNHLIPAAGAGHSYFGHDD